MKKIEEFEEELKILKAWKHDPEAMSDLEVWGISHDLAEAQYPPAKSFFVEGLDDSRWWWRQECVRFLGFHYSLVEETILGKFRTLLLTDLSSDVRMTVAAVLGGRSKLPDQALFIALQSDTDIMVRQVAFESILDLAGLKLKFIAIESRRLVAGEILPNLKDVIRVLEKYDIDLPSDYLILSDEK